MAINGKLPVNRLPMIASAGKRCGSPFVRCANAHLQKTVEEMFSLADSCGKFGLHIDDLKMIFPDRRSQDVLRIHNVTSIELLKTDKAVFFGEVSYLFGQIDMCRWIDATKKYSSFAIIQEKPDGIAPRLDENISSLNIPQLMSRARQFNDDPRTLGLALEYYDEILKREPHNARTITVMKCVAHKRYGYDLENWLKIYETILKRDPACRDAIAVMMYVAHRQYENDLDSQLKIYATILQYNPEYECTLAVMMTLAHHKHYNDQKSRLKIYDVILECNPTNERAIKVMTDLAENIYTYNSPDFIALMDLLEKYHPTSDWSFDMSGLKEKQIILKILYLKRNYHEIVRLTEDVTVPELLKLRSEALRKLA